MLWADTKFALLGGRGGGWPLPALATRLYKSAWLDVVTLWGGGQNRIMCKNGPFFAKNYARTKETREDHGLRKFNTLYSSNVCTLFCTDVFCCEQKKITQLYNVLF